MQVYKLTASEAAACNTLSQSRAGQPLLIVCNYGGCLVVDMTALQQPEFAAYLTLLGGYHLDRVVEVTPPAMP
jgi:hypothetical protein